jgi:molybdopterin-binding protein
MRQVGNPQKVFGSPVDAEVAAFVGVETVIAGKVTASNYGQLFVEADGIRLEAVGDLLVGALVYYCLRPEDVTLSLSDNPVMSSARNRLTGQITRLTPTGPLVRVVIDCGLPVVALITRGSANDMKLVDGMPVTVSFKATAVHLIPR